MDIVNVNGGTIAMGHPLGMSGNRIALHLALELARRGGGVGAVAVAAKATRSSCGLQADRHGHGRWTDDLDVVAEQLPGPCTVEIAAFDEFSGLVAAPTSPPPATTRRR